MKDIKRNLEQHGRNSQMLIIWTDCDPEGENIGAEIADVVRRVNPSILIKRAQFSAIRARLYIYIYIYMPSFFILIFL